MSPNFVPVLDPRLRRVVIVLLSIVTLLGCAYAQNGAVPSLIKFSGTITGSFPGNASILFALYKDQTGGAPLWQEVQSVVLDSAGHYSAMLGAGSQTGLPVDVFANSEARWLGIHVQGQPDQPRVLLVSVPYAMKAADAETLGGLPPSAFLRADASGQSASYINTAAVGSAATQIASTPAIVASGASAGYLPVFTDASGDLGNSLLYQSGGNIGIGTTSPAFPMHFISQGPNPAVVAVDGYGATTGVAFVGRHARGTLASPSALMANDNIFTIQGRGYYSSADGINQGFTASSRAFMKIFAAENWTDTAQGAYISFATTPIGTSPGTSSATEKVRIADNGYVGIGTTSPQYTLDVHGTANFTGLVHFAANQTFPNTGTLTGLTAGAGLSGGGSSGTVTISNTGLLGISPGSGISVGPGQVPVVALDTTNVPLLSANNTFTADQNITGTVNAGGYRLGGYPFAVGSYSLQNSFFGFAGNQTLTGDCNTAIGRGALAVDTAGYCNTANGVDALNSNSTGFYNTASGVSALNANTTGVGNTAVGTFTLYTNTTGSDNLAVGEESGWPSDGSNLTGSNNTFVGAFANPSAGNLTNATAIGANASVGSSNSIILGSIIGINGATANTKVGIGTTAPTYPLSVNGTIQSMTGGFRFPDGTTQASAAVQGVSMSSPDNSVVVGGTTMAPTVAVNAGTVQKRVTGTCAVGQAVTAVNADGSVTCATGLQGPIGPAGAPSLVVKDANGNALGSLVGAGGPTGTDVTVYTNGYFVTVGLSGRFPVAQPTVSSVNSSIFWSGAACTGTAYYSLGWGGSTYTKNVIYSAQANQLMVPIGAGPMAASVSVSTGSQEVTGNANSYTDGASACSSGGQTSTKVWQLIAIDPATTLGWKVTGNPLSVAGPLQLP